MSVRIQIPAKRSAFSSMKTQRNRPIQRRFQDTVQSETDSSIPPRYDLAQMSVWPTAKPAIQRLCSECAKGKKEHLQTKAEPAQRPTVTPTFEAQLQTSRGTGQPLPATTRAMLEPRFGFDFHQVRIHNDTNAAQMNHSLQAQAFTQGQNIYFGTGRYQPESSEGQKLLAHELTHVVQQRNLGASIQTKKLTPEEKAADLQSEDLKHDARLQQAYDNSPVLSRGESSEGVKTLQRTLKKLNYELPVSFAKTGDADGVFGKETYDVLRQFQIDHVLEKKDGIAGRETLGALDQALPGSQQTTCNIQYGTGTLDPQARSQFLQKNFSAQDRPGASKILDDLCEVTDDVLAFASEQELRDEVLKRLRISQYLQQSQTGGGFAYPESSTACPGKTGNSLLDAQVNKDAKDYWKGPILEQRAVIKNQHYYFELTDSGKENGYQALKKLFTPQANICDKTLIHCDSLITLVKILAYADTIGEQRFNEKIKAGQLKIWLTYDGMSAQEGDPTATPASIGYYSFTPSSKKNLLIGDHVVFWNHLAYDAISVIRPGPWRLENALLVDKDSAGNDLYEGHGAPKVDNTIKPGKEEDVLTDLKNVYNSYAKDALAITNKVDQNDPSAQTELSQKYPQVKKIQNFWWVEELDRNKDRPQRYYLLREPTNTQDNELIGLRNPYYPTTLNSVTRPVESK